MPDPLHRLVYRSRSNIGHDDRPALGRIFEVSSPNSQRDKITGALALPDGRFVQALEGCRSALDNLMQRLGEDRRHSDMVVLGDWPITARLFEGWAMAHPDSTPLSEQSFRIITEHGSGAQCTGLLIGLMQTRDALYGHTMTV